jgi:hypothetical protein
MLQGPIGVGVVELDGKRRRFQYLPSLKKLVYWARSTMVKIKIQTRTNRNEKKTTDDKMFFCHKYERIMTALRIISIC